MLLSVLSGPLLYVDNGQVSVVLEFGHLALLLVDNSWGIRGRVIACDMTLVKGLRLCGEGGKPVT